MKLIVIAAAIALLPLSVAFGQAQVEKPAALPADEARPAPQKGVNLVQGPGQSAVKEDARHCLELSTNNEIIKCAAPYLPAKRH